NEHIPVKAAFWLKETDRGRWHLYVASDKMNGSEKGDSYGEVLRVVAEMNDPNFSPFRVKLIGSSSPLAQAALDFSRRYPGKVLSRFDGGQFGGVSVDGLYIYPPPAHGASDGRW